MAKVYHCKLGANLVPTFAALMADVNAELQKVVNRSEDGLIDATVHIRRTTEDKVPRTPVDVGNLRASWFGVTRKGSVPDTVGSGSFRSNPETGVKAEKMAADHRSLVGEARAMTGGKDPVSIMGFSAFYAAPVHEMEGADFTGKNARGSSRRRSRRPGAGPKYLETHVYEEKDEIIRIVAKRAKIK